MYEVKKQLDTTANRCTINPLMEVSEVELVYRSKVRASDRPQVKSSKEVYAVLLQSWDRNKIDYVE